MFFKITYRIIILLTLLLGFSSLFLSERYIKKQFAKRSFDLAKNTVSSVSTIEIEMDKSLKAAAFVAEERLLNGTLKTEQDLINIKNELGVTALSILDGNTGKLLITTNQVFDKNNQFYKELSLKDVEQCETQKCGDKFCRIGYEILNCKIKRTETIDAIKNPGQLYLIPMMRVNLYSDTPIKSPAKWVVLYNKKLNKIIDVFYAKRDITKILEEYIDIHSDTINYISLTDDRGNLIVDAGIKQDATSHIVSLPFSKSWSFSIEGAEVVNYKYIINIQFSKKERNKQILVTRILFITIILLIMALLWAVRSLLAITEGEFNTVRNILIKEKLNN